MSLNKSDVSVLGQQKEPLQLLRPPGQHTFHSQRVTHAADFSCPVVTKENNSNRHGKQPKKHTLIIGSTVGRNSGGSRSSNSSSSWFCCCCCCMVLLLLLAVLVLMSAAPQMHESNPEFTARARANCPVLL